MKLIRSFEFKNSSKEELLPGFTPDFPYMMSRAELNRYPPPCVPWHWHKPVELFYVESGTLEYTTPKGTWIFPAGSGGMVNSNVLHSSRPLKSTEPAVQLLHIFDPGFLAGDGGNRMETRYILPLTGAADLEVIPLSPQDPSHIPILEMIRDAFSMAETDWGYEFRIRNALCDIWLKLLILVNPSNEDEQGQNRSTDTVKDLLIYIHEHYRDPISVEELAGSVHISKRACFRLFQECLHITPIAYIRNYRLQKACSLLVGTNYSLTDIAYQCGLGSSSYFGKVFRETFGITPSQYRASWHDSDNFRQ